MKIFNAALGCIHASRADGQSARLLMFLTHVLTIAHGKDKSLLYLRVH